MCDAIIAVIARKFWKHAHSINSIEVAWNQNTQSIRPTSLKYFGWLIDLCTFTYSFIYVFIYVTFNHLCIRLFIYLFIHAFSHSSTVSLQNDSCTCVDAFLMEQMTGNYSRTFFKRLPTLSNFTAIGLSIDFYRPFICYLNLKSWTTSNKQIIYKEKGLAVTVCPIVCYFRWHARLFQNSITPGPILKSYEESTQRSKCVVVALTFRE